jgi:D-alanyl-D-alanine endopeptidase (penicillin-binding protein 7)
MLACTSVTAAQRHRAVTKHHAYRDQITKLVAQHRTPPSYSLFNVTTGSYQYTSGDHEDGGVTRPIASISKIMTVLVVLREGYNLDEIVPVSAERLSYRIRPGMTVTRRELIYLALVSSDNLAARTLAQTSPVGYDSFVKLMNATAYDLGLNHTHFFDPIGLSMNVSTSAEITQLMSETQKYPIFAETANLVNYELITTLGTRPVKVEARATNYYAGRMNLLASKTGYTSAAGNCVTMLFERDGTRYTLVVLGAHTQQHRRQIVDQLLATLNTSEGATQ